ncbi:ribonuclease P protein component [Flavihumibacter rivuli]|nr:ribonuclease P protein component [Flavihumibacter rivuli]ULQ56105.1 ribonuclease P protein component [Flavihumibacter rivuli]
MDALFSKGKSFAVFPYRVYYLWLDPALVNGTGSPVLFGCGVGKKHFKKAVDRNRIKRLTREAYRTQKHELLAAMATRGGQLAVFFIFTGKELPLLADCVQTVGRTLQRLTQMVKERHA